MATAVEALIQRQDAVLAFLRDNGQLSLAIDFEGSYRPLLVLACGSFFESYLTDHLCSFTLKSSDPRVAAFIKNKSLKRQYHTLFNWEQANINQFLGFFGEEYKAATIAAINSDKDLLQGMRDFLQLGSARNSVAHSNLSALSPDLTIEDIKQLYSRAWTFLKFLCNTLDVVQTGDNRQTPAPP